MRDIVRVHSRSYRNKISINTKSRKNKKNGLTIQGFVSMIAVIALLVMNATPYVSQASHGGPYGDQPVDKIVLCHDEGGNGSGYHSSGGVNVSSVLGNGGHGEHATDIIPPFHYQKNPNSPIESYNGLNWNSSKEDIWNGNGTWDNENDPTDKTNKACTGDGILDPVFDLTIEKKWDQMRKT